MDRPRNPAALAAHIASCAECQAVMAVFDESALIDWIAENITESAGELGPAPDGGT